MNAVAITGPADLRDQRWLDERIETARNGIEAVIDIALNWTEGRNVSRLHPGVAAADYVREHIGLIGREAVVPLLTASNWSNRQIAAVAGISRNDVNELALSVPVDRPTETLGADGKLRPVTPFRPHLDATPYEYGHTDGATALAPEPEPEKWAPAPGLMSSDSAEWYTPKRVLDAVVLALGAIDLDPCADPEKSVPATTHYTEAEDGLGQEWAGRVYMNPPYGRGIDEWVDKLAAAHKSGEVPEAIALLPGRIETDWFYAVEAEWLCNIEGRLAFSGHPNAAPFPSIAAYLGPNGEAFADAFVGLGDVYQRRRRFAR